MAWGRGSGRVLGAGLGCAVWRLGFGERVGSSAWKRGLGVRLGDAASLHGLWVPRLGAATARGCLGFGRDLVAQLGGISMLQHQIVNVGNT